MADVGAAQAATVSWRGIIGPKGVPADRVAILERAFRQAVQTPKFREFAKKDGGNAVGSTAVEFAELIRTEYQAFAQIVKELGLGKR